LLAIVVDVADYERDLQLATTLELDPCLVADARQGATGRPVELRFHRQREVAERLQRSDASFRQGAPLPT